MAGLAFAHISTVPGCTIAGKTFLSRGRAFAIIVILWYNEAMKNWSVDTTELQKDPEKFSVWRLEQMINFGLDNEKIDLNELRKYWDIIHIDPYKRKFLSLSI